MKLHLQLLALTYFALNNAFEDSFGGLPVYIDFDSYQCFTDTEISTLDSTLLSGITLSDIKQQELNRLGLAIDDWALPGSAAAIIMKEMFNISNITLISFYLNAFDVLTLPNYTDIMIPSQFELYPADFDPTQWNQLTSITGDLTDLLSGIEIFAGIYGKTEWLENMETDFDSACEYGDFWRSYENPDIISIMSPSSEVANVIQEDGYYECSPERFEGLFDDYPCINGTYVPSQCLNGNCSSIVGFSPWYDLGLIQAFLTDYSQVNLDIKYIGEQEIAAVHLNEYISSHDTLFTFWQPSIMVSSGQFKLIQMPSDYITQQMDQIHKLIPSDLNKISSFIYEFLESVQMTNYDYEWILNKSYLTNGFNQTSLTRLEGSCQWLRHLLLDTNIDNDLSDPRDWIPTSIMNNIPYVIQCNDYTDQQLEKLSILENYNEKELLTTLKYKNDLEIITMLDESGIDDVLQSFRIKRKCLYTTTPTTTTITSTRTVIGGDNMTTTNSGKNDNGSDSDDSVWMIVAIIFIVLFVIAIIYIAYQCMYKNNNNGGAPLKHGRVNTVDADDEHIDQQELGKIGGGNETTPMNKVQIENDDLL